MASLLKISSSSSNRKVLGTSAGFEESDSENECQMDTNVNSNARDEVMAQCFALKNEGCTLAESGDYHGALNVWHRGLQLDPANYVLHELKAQVYLELDMYMPAMQAAEQAVEINPNWGVGYHTLARCQREAGEVCLSLKNYQTAAALLPSDDLIASELVEVQGLSAQLHQMRLERYEALQRSDKNSPAHEANSCIYHLSARASGLITQPSLQSQDPK